MKAFSIRSFGILLLLVLIHLGEGWAETAAPVTQRQVRLGGLQVLSGPAAEEYRGISLGMQAYFRFVNELGGVHGRQIDYRALDSRLQAERVPTLMENLLLEEPVLALVGSVGEPVLGAYPDWFEDVGIPDLLSIGRPTNREPLGRLSFSPSLAAEALALGRFCAQALAGERILVWYRERSSRPELIEYFEAGAAGLVQIEALPSRVPLFQLEEELDQLIAEAPAAIVVLGDYLEVQAFVWQYQEWNIPIYTGSALANTEVLSKFDESTQQRLHFLTYLPLLAESQQEGVRLHQRILKEYFPNQLPNHWTLLGHAIAETAIELLRRSGTRLSAYQIALQLDQTFQWQGLLTPPLRFPSKGSLITSFRLARWEQSQVKYLSDWIPADDF